MMLATRLLFALAMTLALPAPAAAEPGVVESVRFESHPDRLDFYFTATTAIDGSLAEKIPVRGGEVLILRLGGVTAKRRWVKLRDRLIKRALLHPSTQRPPGAILRVRFKRKVITPELVKEIRAEYVGADRRTVRISVPRPAGKGRKRQRPRAKAEPIPPETPKASTTAGDADQPPETATEPAIDATDTPPDDDPPAAAPPEPRPMQPVPEPSPVLAVPSAPEFEAVVSPPAPKTTDVTAGLDGFVDRLRLGIEQRSGVPRIAMLPLTALDRASLREHLDESSSALVGSRLLHRPGLVMVDPTLFGEGLERLHRGEDGRFALDDARALAAMLGADTLVAGSVMSDGDAVTVSGRAIDVETGRDLSATRQPFDRSAMRALSDAIRDEQTASAAILQSALLPGLGQIGQGHSGRGAGYLTGFVAALGAGVVSVALGASAESDYNQSDPSTVSRRDDADAHYARSGAFFVAAGAVWLASLVDAIVTSEDRVEYDLSAHAAPR